MAIADSVKRVKAKYAGFAEKEKHNHKVVNIMMTVLFSLVFLLTLFGGVNVDVGSTVKGDGNEAVVHQSFIKVVGAALNCNMSADKAEKYVNSVNDKLINEYGVLGFNLYKEGLGAESVPYENLNEFGQIVKQMQKRDADLNKNDAKKINWILYRYAYANALLNNSIEDPTVTDMSDLQASWGGNMAVVLEGQSIYTMLFGIALLIISAVMLVYAILSLIKKKPFTRAKTAFLMLSLVMFLSFIFSFSFIRPDWTHILTAVLVFGTMIAYSLIMHIMMDNRDFSPTMFVHNVVLLLGAIISFILVLLPMFKITDADAGKTVQYGLSFIYDLSAAQSAYLAQPMSYLLTVLLFMAVIGLPAFLCALLIIRIMSRFISADYQHNEKRISLILTTAITVLVFLLLGLVNKEVSELYLTISMVIPIMIIQPVMLASLVVFEILFKVKPVKKELVIR